MRRAGWPAAAALAAAAFIPAAHGSPEQDYLLYCMGCHGAEAQGVPGKIPPLAGALARFMRTGEGRNYVLRVPGAADSLQCYGNRTSGADLAHQVDRADVDP